MLAFKVVFAGVAIGMLILVSAYQRALRPPEVSAPEQPYEAPASNSDRLDGLVKLREQMIRAKPGSPLAAEPPLQQTTHGSIPGAVSGTSLIAQANVGDDSM